MATTNIRVVGSNFTTFNYNNMPLLWLDSVKISGQAVVGGQQGGGYETVTPLGSPYVQEVVTGRILGPGRITCTVREAWNAPAWQQLTGLAGTNDLAAVFAAMATTGNISCTMIIKPPGSTTWRGQVYNNCTVVGINDGETIDIGTLSINRDIEILYTNKVPFTGSGPAVY
jgi:hypothetical protein